MNNEFAELAKARESGHLDISGTEYSAHIAIQRSLLAAVLFATAAGMVWWAFSMWPRFGEAEGIKIFIASIVCVVGLWLPKGEHHFIDLKSRTVIKLSWYGFSRSSEEAPLNDFSRIVVRHVCHPGGEAEDTFTGSVGVKPNKAGPVLWIKDFPATKDEMPSTPDQFARELSRLIGLPYFAYTASGSEGAADAPPFRRETNTV